ncbi:hypothetical protein ABTY96_41975 [Streptomyces sp. NPDC096057]|uniref:hypothetical protein n=1 Tax=Streptomyces sp. NPDC096057 TaxID=3155543 RepID=UPI0033310C07
MPGMPPFGAETPCSILAIGSVIEYGDTTITCDFRGGVKHRVDVDPNDPMNSVLLRTVGFKASAETDKGSIAIEQNDADVAPQSKLTLTQQFPPKYTHHDVQSFIATLDLGTGEPVVLTTKEPMVCDAQLTQFPPRGDLYKLSAPVDMVDPSAPDTVVARLTTFTSKRGGL